MTSLASVIELGTKVSSRLRSRISASELARRKRAALVIEEWVIRRCLRRRRVGGVTFTTWCHKLHGLYVSSSDGETVATPFFLGRENGPSVVSKRYWYLSEDGRIVEETTEPGEMIHYTTSPTYLMAVSMLVPA